MLLTGLLRCGQCGSRMTSRLDRGHRVYVCGTYVTRGSRACNCNSVHEAILVPAILAKLREQLTPAGLERLEALIAEEAARTDAAPADLAGLTARLAELDAQVSRAARRLLTAEDDAELPDLRAALADLRRERDHLAAAAERQRRAALGRPGANEVIRRARDWLNRLEHAAGLSRPDLRTFLSDVIDPVEMHFTARKVRVRTRTAFVRGLIYLNQATPATSILNASCPRSARSTA